MSGRAGRGGAAAEGGGSEADLVGQDASSRLAPVIIASAAACPSSLVAASISVVAAGGEGKGDEAAVDEANVLSGAPNARRT